MIGKIVLLNRNGTEFRLGLRRHFPGNVAFIVFATVEGQSESAQWPRVVTCRETEDSARVDSSTEVTTYRNIGAEADANSFVQGIPKFLGIFRIRSHRPSIGRARIVEIPILVNFDLVVSRKQVVAGRYLGDTLEQRAPLMATDPARMIKGLAIPARRHSCCEEGLHFGCKVKNALVHCIEERLDTKPVPGGKQRSIDPVPKDDCEFAPQPLQAMSTEVFVKMESHLAIRSSPKPMSVLFEFLLNRLVIVEFAVNNNAKSFVFICDRLISGREVDDTKTRVPQPDSTIGSDPVSLSVGAPVMKAFCGFLQDFIRDGCLPGTNCNDSAHSNSPRTYKLVKPCRCRIRHSVMVECSRRKLHSRKH